jgi:hypothetical protein
MDVSEATSYYTWKQTKIKVVKWGTPNLKKSKIDYNQGHFSILCSIFSSFFLRLGLGGQISAVEDEDRFDVEVEEHVHVLHHVRYVAVRFLTLKTIQ